MVEESSPLLLPAEESKEAETTIALEPEPESGQHTVEPTSEPGFICGCDEWMRSPCKGLPFYKEHENNRYCVLHYPGKEKAAEFKAALDKKLNDKDFDFRGVWFPEAVWFHGFEFSADADFTYATFSTRADFSDASFSAAASFRDVTFSAGAQFSGATFSATAQFSDAMFGAATYFSNATFGAAASFRSATFSAEAYFTHVTFSAPPVFSYATFNSTVAFSDATFKMNALFSCATFSRVAFFLSATFSAASYFDGTTFSSDAYFSGSAFRGAAYFSSATFSANAYFSSATFSDADFNLSVFHARADFSRASFNDSIHFFGSATERLLKDGSSLAPMALGKDPSLDFQHVRIEYSEQIAFHTLNLRPHWFVNVDSRQFAFTDVSWERERISIKQEIAALEASGVESPSRLLAIACRQLADNAEANNRYEEASRFRYWAMNLARLTKWKGWSFWKTDWLHMLYWAVSGYGERILRALGVLAAVWIVFVLLYTQVGFVQQQPSNQATSSATTATMPIEDKIGQPLEFSRALTYSLAMMSLQKPEPRPLTGTAQTLVLLETILGPVQAALLLLAIRRKFMR